MNLVNYSAPKIDKGFDKEPDKGSTDGKILPIF